MANQEDRYAETKDNIEEISSAKKNWDPTTPNKPPTTPNRPSDDIPIPDGIPINPNDIRINNIEGPLVVFFGPKSIGKTVTLLRLCNYISKYDITPEPNFRTDDQYPTIIREFEKLRRTLQFAPGATGLVNFLLLNVTYRGEKFCQILEAPGEHFFDPELPHNQYVNYFNEILNRSYRKVFVFFFSINMFRTDQDRRNYADKIARLVNERVISARDRVIIVCNKCDENPYIVNGKPVTKQFKDALYKHEAFGLLEEVLKRSGLGRISFIPFSAGTFVPTGIDQYAFSLSPDHYPEKLWREIHECVEGEPWWRFLKFW